jgi:hypothetical protein
MSGRLSATFKMYRCSTGPLRVVKDPDPVLTTPRTGSYSE